MAFWNVNKREKEIDEARMCVEAADISLGNLLEDISVTSGWTEENIQHLLNDIRTRLNADRALLHIAAIKLEG